MSTYLISGAVCGAIVYVAVAILMTIVAYASAPSNMPRPLRLLTALGFGAGWVIIALVGMVVFIVAGGMYLLVLLCGG